jgi:hypothetical protein
VCGSIAAAIVGFMIGKLGGLLLTAEARQASFLLILPAAGIIFAARESKWIQFRVPERRLQTEPGWFRDFGIIPAAAMWGFHIGLGFMTRITYMGFWLLIAIIAAAGSSGFGASLLLFYWLGRVLSVWVAPLVLSREEDSVGVRIMGCAAGGLAAYRRIQVVANLWSGAIAFVIGWRSLG